jgi:voltage-gated potassium channel
MTTVEQWEKRAEPALAIAALAFLAAYAIPILDTRLNGSLRALCRAVDYTVWIIFGLDYLTRVALAKRRMHYISRHVPDLAMIALPVLRPLRLLRVVMLLRLLNRQATESLRGRVAFYVGGSTVLVVFCASLAELEAERHNTHANIVTFGDAIWWAITTMSTVGYGDRYPVTTEGRFVAAGLMLAGVALIGVVTASIASWLIDRVREVETETQAATRHDIAALRAELHALRTELARSTDQVASSLADDPTGGAE